MIATSLETLPAAAPARKQLEAQRAKIVATKAAIAELDSLPRSRDEVRQQLLGLAESGKRVGLNPHATFCEFTNHADTAPMPIELSWADLVYVVGEAAFADAVLRRLDADPPSGWPGITAVERKAKLDQLQADLAEAQRVEEREILRLKDAGHRILRRGDADPAILLAAWAEHEVANG